MCLPESGENKGRENQNHCTSEETRISSKESNGEGNNVEWNVSRRDMELKST